MTDYDDPAVEAKWLSERREELAHYLKREDIAHGPIADEAAWHVAPYVSLWAIGSVEKPGAVGWWGISGDLPNDYVSSSDATTPREAVTAIASLWKDAAEYMKRGERHPTFTIGTGEDDEELAPLLESRAEILLEWASDATLWE